MSSRFESSFGNAGRSPKTMSVSANRRVMSEKELQAYLVSRDTVRRIQTLAAASGVQRRPNRQDHDLAGSGGRAGNP